MSWVLRHSDETLGRRLVLLVLADHAGEEGRDSWPSVDTIAHEARMSRRQVQRCLRDLEASGAITRLGTHPSGATQWGVKMSPPRGDIRAAGGATSAARGGRNPDARTVSKATTPNEPSSWRVDRKPVTRDEREIAQSVLAEWNVLTEQSLSARTWLAKIVMRVREHPELGVNEHAHIIRTALADPWWRGVATPSVIYGNDAIFERQLMAAAKRTEGGAAGAFKVALAALEEAS
jgi:helix-turn-helix protein